MKDYSLIFIITTIFAFSFVETGCKGKSQTIREAGEPEGTAILITGAAARIPQEAALLEQLDKTGQLKNVVFIAGASSGALNTVMLNAILDKKITWNQYYRWLSEISTPEIYKMDGKKLPVDTTPLKYFLSRIVNDSIGYYKMKDLPIPSAISITEVNLLGLPKKNYCLSNLKINSVSDPNLDLVEVLMASTAFPLVFPDAKISNSTTLTEHKFVDGGIGEGHVPYKGLIDFINYRGKSVEKVIIVSRKSDLKPDLSEELALLGITDKEFFDKIGVSLDEILFKGFIKGLRKMEQEVPDLKEKTFVYVPAFSENFLLINFNHLKEQYDTTRNWAQDHQPVPLTRYLEENKHIASIGIL